MGTIFTNNQSDAFKRVLRSRPSFRQLIEANLNCGNRLLEISTVAQTSNQNQSTSSVHFKRVQFKFVVQLVDWGESQLLKSAFEMGDVLPTSGHNPESIQLISNVRFVRLYRPSYNIKELLVNQGKVNWLLC